MNNRPMNFIQKAIKRREFFIVAVVIVLFAGMAIINPVFVSGGNIQAMLISISSESIIAVGMTLILICGMIDLSVASNLAFSAMASGLLILAGWPVWLGVIAGIAIGAAVGAFNGFCIAVLKINFFVVTLASMNIFRGLMVIISNGSSIFQFPKEFTNLGQEKFLGLQYPIWVFIIVMIIAQFLFTKTRFFRQSYYIGGNEKAARLSGINIDRTKFLYFVIIGGLCGLSGVVTAARFGAVATSLAGGMELRIITAVIVGGASLSGGAGTIIGTFFGSILMAALNNIITLEGANIYWQTFITGVTLFIAVALDQLIIINKKRQDIKSAEQMLRKQEISISEKVSKQNLSV